MTKKMILLYLLLIVSMANVVRASETLEVWMDKSVSFTADGQTVTKLVFREKDPNINYIAFNMTLTVPKGIHINKVKSGRNYVNDIKLTERKDDHTIACNMPDETTVRIICTSPVNAELYPDDEDGNQMDELFEIGFVADATTYNGTYAIEMTGCKFVQNDENDQIIGHVLDHTEYCDFVISGGTDFPGVDYTLSSARIGTLILPFNTEIPNGMSAYECNGISGDKELILNKVNSFTANTPYIIAGEPTSYHFNGKYRGMKDSYSTNYMTGVYVESIVPKGSYVLQKHENDNVAFYNVDRNDLTISPYRCYLNKSTLDVSCLKIILDETSSINDINKEDGTTVTVYSLDGKALRINVNKEKALVGLAKGVYIINNKKYVIK